MQQSMQQSMPQSGPQAMPKGPPKSAAAMGPSQSMGGKASGGGMMEQMSGMMGQMMGQAPMAPANTPSKSQMNAVSNVQMTGQAGTELPGFPGAPHIYHIGATGFFLDHGDAIKLTTEQLSSLTQVKRKSLAEQSSFNSKIKKAEEELWTLTASDRPDISSIEIKIQEIEAAKAKQRFSFIRDVGEAANILSVEQRTNLMSSTDAKSPEQNADPMTKPENKMPTQKTDPDMNGSKKMEDM